MLVGVGKISSIIGTVLVLCTPLKSVAEENPSIPIMDMYILTEAGHMVSNQASVNNVIDVAYSAPFCYHLFSSDTNKQFWRAVGLHSFSALAITESLQYLEDAYDVPYNTFRANDARHWWSGAEQRAQSILTEKGKEWADSFTIDTCLYLINHYTTYGKIPVPDGPLINPR